MTHKNDMASAASGLLLTAPSAPAIRSAYSPQPMPAHQYLYFTETDTDRILDNLDGLRDIVFHFRLMSKTQKNYVATNSFHRCA